MGEQYDDTRDRSIYTCTSRSAPVAPLRAPRLFGRVKVRGLSTAKPTYLVVGGDTDVEKRIIQYNLYTDSGAVADAE